MPKCLHAAQRREDAEMRAHARERFPFLDDPRMVAVWRPNPYVLSELLPKSAQYQRNAAPAADSSQPDAPGAHA